MAIPPSTSLQALREIARALCQTLDRTSAVARVVELLEDELGTLAATVALADPDSRDLRIEAASGLARDAARRASFHPGEGITGRVFDTGRPVVLPDVAKEPLFLDRSGLLAAARRRRREMAYVSVPIPGEKKRAGVLGAAFPRDPHRDWEDVAAVLEVAAAILGQTLRAHGLVEAERQRLQAENRLLKEELRERYELRNLVGNSAPMRRVYELVAQAAPSSATVLLRGESGTGKELVAHAIHYGSARSARPFVRVSCAALPESLVESELFGHEAGAFTGAKGRRPGRFELADGGTLFLDEVGEISPAVQVKLLRVLQEREFERVGGTEPVRVDVRLIAATNKDLEAAMRAGTFREDLFYRLDVFSIFVPPLRERRTDIPLLADHFVERLAREHRRDVRRIATTAIDVLMSYHWPGNVRELANCIERAVLVCEGGVIHAHHLPPTLQTAEVSGTLPQTSLEAALGTFEKDLLLDAVKIARGNRARAARLLQTTERILSYRLRRHGIDPDRFRPSGSSHTPKDSLAAPEPRPAPGSGRSPAPRKLSPPAGRP
ncbi:MAG: sigma 54-interacting transcriptional regulator [Holophagales bacterium]|nr:sigma 54-interacting transcriptional regulator [Holophagales bacterium]